MIAQPGALVDSSVSAGIQGGTGRFDCLKYIADSDAVKIIKELSPAVDAAPIVHPEVVLTEATIRLLNVGAVVAGRRSVTLFAGNDPTMAGVWARAMATTPPHMILWQPACDSWQTN